MPSLRTRTVSTKVTEGDYALFAQLAGDLSVGEWVREVLLKAVLSERTAELSPRTFWIVAREFSSFEAARGR